MQESKLDFAYKYPSSKEAKEVVAKLKISTIEPRYLQEGISQLKSALKEGRIYRDKVRGISEVKYKYIMGYVYARMLVSAIGDRYSISRFAAAEASAASDFLAMNIDDLISMADEIGLGAKRELDGFAMSFEKFVSIPKKDDRMKLINQRLVKGTVYVNVQQLLALVQDAIEKQIRTSLPIDKRNLPRQVMEAAREIKPQEQKIAMGTSKGTYAWIEKLLANPIADVRHRSVNLILAPYLVNVKRLEPESATKVIVAYIEKCRAINPNTKINETYIRYQCNYAKRKGLKPMSLSRARELLKEVVEFE